MKLTEEEIKEVITQYKNGLSSKKIADLFNVSSTTIKNILHKNNVQIKETSSYLKKFPQEKEIEVILYYNKGNSITSVAKYFKCSQEVIRRILKQNMINILPSNTYIKKFSKDQEQKIIELYNKGLSTIEIGKKYKVKRTTISKILKENNIEIRKKSISLEQEKRIIELYKKGASIKDISKERGFADNTIRKTLIRNNLYDISKTRKISKKTIVSTKNQLKISNLYLLGESIDKLTEQFGISYPTVRKILSINNVKVRKMGYSKNQKKFTKAQINKIIDLYNNGITTIKIANEFNTSREIILSRLKKNNVKIRMRGYTSKILKNEQEKELIELYNKEKNMSKVAKHFDVSVSVVRRILKKTF